MESSPNIDELIEYVRKKAGVKLDKKKLLIGFARRAAPYKRTNLIFSNPNEIESCLRKGHLQIIFSGKAHPLDDEGKRIISALVEKTNEYSNSVIFLADYNIEIAKVLTKGVDVWLNSSRKPLEASGTSGMKATMSGVLNLSILDGWWPGTCEHGSNGWQFGDGYEGTHQDEHDAKALYKVLIKEVISTYYNDRKNGWR